MKIDGVFSGGGIKGYALIGAIQAIEQKGFSFVRVAGTSVGSIIASFILAGYTGKEIEQLMEEVNLEQFLDSRRTIIPTSLARWFILYWKMGLYKGDVIEKWTEEKLAKKGINVFGDLPKGSLRIVASDLTNGKMVVLPDDLPKYGYQPEKFPIAMAVRMSAGLPYFFEPVRLLSSKSKPIIVDGGVLSNFPLWLFEQQKRENTRPLLGIKLSPSFEDKTPNKITNALTMYKALFETMLDAHDARYISRTIEKNILFLPVKNVVTREFNVTDEKKREMIDLGYQHAIDFLKTWSY